MNPTAAFAVNEVSQVGEPRRALRTLASQLGFSEERAGRAALALSELATNLLKHAREGEILVRPLSSARGELTGVEIIAIDRGPGISDVALSRRDGYSTTGTLGHGLGAIERQADSFELYTGRSGTIIVARVWRERPVHVSEESSFEVGGVQVSKPGESVCGDAWSWRASAAHLGIFVADGLGHGLAAHDAASLAVAVFARNADDPPRRIVSDVHAALRPTRGAAVAALSVNLERGTATYAGLGNIAGAILLANGGRHNLVSHNGTAGHTAARIQEFSYPVPGDSTVVMYSDGLTGHWDLTAYPGLRTRSPTIIAAVLYRDFSRRRDDATVVVAKARPPVAEKL
jgi:anti-sigma regulatory factor (Ser/Thr protein kinase)